jgi:large conductance mechanosensitive channel
LREEIVDNTGMVPQELIAIKYGNFIQEIFDFFIISMTVFMEIKKINRLRRKAENEKDTTVSTPRDIQLLSEIRDLLKEK